MSLIKKTITRLQSFYHAIQRFILSIVFLVFAEIFNAINIQSETDDYEKFILTMIAGAFFSLLARVIHERFLTGTPAKYLLLFASIILTGIYYWLVIPSGNIDTETITRTSVLFFAILIAFLWVPVIKKKFSFNESFMAFFKSFFVSLFFSAVLWGGVSLILAAINELLFTIDQNAFSHTSGVIFLLFSSCLFPLSDS